MRNLLYMILFLSIIECKAQIIESKGIENIIIENINTTQRITITDNSQITQLLKIINSSSREFYIFIPNYRIIISYVNNKKKVVLLKGMMLKIDGISYKANKKLSEIIEIYFR